MQREGETGAMWGQEDEAAEPASLCPPNSYISSKHFSPKEKKLLYNFHFILNRELLTHVIKNALQYFLTCLKLNAYLTCVLTLIEEFKIIKRDWIDVNSLFLPLATKKDPDPPVLC